MMVSDYEFWNILTSTVMPMKANKVKKETKKLKVNSNKIPKIYPTVLDLHGKTIQEAYNSTLNFIQKHKTLDTRYILIITGKARDYSGLIRREFDKWLDTEKFKINILEYEWVNGNGAIRLKLKRNK